MHRRDFLVSSVLGSIGAAVGGFSTHPLTASSGSNYGPLNPALMEMVQARIDALKAAGFEIGKNLVLDYQNAQGNPGTARNIIEKFMADKVDLLATPTIPTCLPTLAETDIDHGPPGTERRFMAVSVNTRPFNYLGLPAASAPCGLDPNGLPIGLQIVAPLCGEARLVGAMRAAEAVLGPACPTPIEPRAEAVRP